MSTGNADHPSWLSLDNAAKIYPASLSHRSPAVFRLSVTLRNPIRVSTLEQALRTVLPRCPYYQVYLRRGLFWYFLERHDEIPELYPMTPAPVSFLPRRRQRAHLLRVQARGSTIAIDFSHILTDGAGGFRFLGTLAAQYLRLRGVSVTSWEPFLDPEERPSPEEYEDAYRKHFRGGMPWPRRLSPAYHLPSAADSPYRVITGRLSVAEMLGLARDRGVSLTEYLIALYMFSLARVRASHEGRQERLRRGLLRVEVPVDMRRFYPSRTMRNFSLYASPEVDLDLGSYSLDELIQRVHHSMRIQVDRKEMDRQIGRNVEAERNPFMRIMPLFLKDQILSLIHRRLGINAYSGVLSNLGRITVPAEIEPHIASFGVVLDSNAQMKVNCAVLSFRDDLSISFGSLVADRDVERIFFSTLARAGVGVTVSEQES